MGTKHDEITQRLAKHIELKQIAWLKPYERNARTHSPEQLEQIAASIAEFGFVNPILAKKDGTIIAGHGRLEASTKILGLKEVPVIVLDHLTDNQARLLVLADNKIAMNAGWDEEMLAEEIMALEDLGASLELTGFDEDELADLLGDADELDGMPSMENKDKPAFQQMTFTLHDKQAKKVKAAIRAAIECGEFTDGLNENSNGNALARICHFYLESLKENPDNPEPPRPKKTTKAPAKKKGKSAKK